MGGGYNNILTAGLKECLHVQNKKQVYWWLGVEFLVEFGIGEGLMHMQKGSGSVFSGSRRTQKLLLERHPAG